METKVWRLGAPVGPVTKALHERYREFEKRYAKWALSMLHTVEQRSVFTTTFHICSLDEFIRFYLSLSEPNRRNYEARWTLGFDAWLAAIRTSVQCSLNAI